MPASTTHVVTSGPVPLAVRHHPADGPALVLLHGAGGNLGTMVSLAELLVPDLSVTLLDFRSHGESGDGPWEWDAVLADLDQVIAELGLGEPFVAGMSLGGMVAGLWAAARSSCPGVVSLDGQPSPVRPEQLAGMAPQQAQAEIDRLRRFFDEMEAAMANAAEPQRPGGEFLGQLRHAMDELDIPAVYRKVKSPLLAVLATQDFPQQAPFHDLYEAFRTWLRTELDSVAAVNPNITVHPLEGASHGMVFEMPETIAQIIREFIGKVGGPKSPTHEGG